MLYQKMVFLSLALFLTQISGVFGGPAEDYILNTCQDCFNDSSCADGYSCINDQCVIKECDTSSDCAPGKTCIKLSCCFAEVYPWSPLTTSSMCLDETCGTFYPSTDDTGVCGADGNIYDNATTALCAGVCINGLCEVNTTQAETTTELVSETTTQLVSETTTELVSETTTQIVSETTTELVSETTTQIVSETTTQLASETTVAETTTESGTTVEPEATTSLEPTTTTKDDDSDSPPAFINRWKSHPLKGNYLYYSIAVVVVILLCLVAILFLLARKCRSSDRKDSVYKIELQSQQYSWGNDAGHKRPSYQY